MLTLSYHYVVLFYISEDKESLSLDPVHQESTTQDEDVDDYSAYLQGYDMDKYGNEHAKFKAAEKAMQKRQHEKVTKVSKVISCFMCYLFFGETIY